MALQTLFLILLATIINSLIALVGVATFWFSEKRVEKILFILVAFSTGTLLGGAFLHLTAEALEMMESMSVFLVIIAGFSMFFLIEKFLHWHHCHEGHCDVHPFTYMILVGDGIHNFLDGLIIAASFIINPALGLVTTIMILSHELPQELGDFGVLVYGGMKRRKALTYNLISQMTSILGGMVGFILAGVTEFSVFLLPFAAGGFIYIAASDLTPELHKEADKKKSLLAFGFFIVGVLFMLATKIVFGG